MIEPEAGSGSRLIYAAATGLERALADVEAPRLLGIYAELVSDQWDPNAISYRNLPFLAWAEGVNLWEDDWSETFRRWWVANQWTFKQQRGSLLGQKTFISAVGFQLISAIVPPAKFFPSVSLTDAQRAAYVARFPQLRLYPYVGGGTAGYLCFVSGIVSGGVKRRSLNGSVLGPLKKFYATGANLRPERFVPTATLWDQGVETTLTTRVVTSVATGTYTATSYAEVTLPARTANYWFLGQAARVFLPSGHPRTQNTHGIFLGANGATAARIVRIPTDGSLNTAEAKAIYQTITPDLTPLDIYPDYVNSVHQARASSLFAGSPTGKQYLSRKYLPSTVSWRYSFQRWYLFDPTRVPDARKATAYMGRARFGIPKYTAELKVQAFGVYKKFFLYCGGHMRGFFRAPSTATIDKLRRAVTAAMAVRDTVHINTIVKRVVQVSDAPLTDGSVYVGAYIDA